MKKDKITRDGKTVKRFTPKDILALYFDFKSFQPSKRTWNEHTLHDNPPRLYRLKMLQSLFKAFGLGSIKTFHEGGFVLKRNIEDYSVLIERIKTDTKAHISYPLYIPPIRLPEIRYLFITLLRYRDKLDGIMGFNRGNIQAAGIYGYTCYKIEQINNVIKTDMSIIDNLIKSIISPSNQNISREGLIVNFGYPDVDLGEIDIERL